ncbi:hypothetical protein NDU88_003516 [Pleurodeles waltl]|uniref:Reverse transcriptase domain-containing protein n=1 Tax=Pleurodeles waltl TaxID=8319 RepID=A0AAV7LH64_PLEWA|nr:hypothetical protein NDU88_003516 [Pleurodeles waltl]
MPVNDGLKKLLAEMLEDGGIEPVEESEWVSPMVITKKADGCLRFCVDLLSVNQNIVVDVFPLPSINELLTLVKDKRYFSKLDLRNAYHQRWNFRNVALYQKSGMIDKEFDEGCSRMMFMNDGEVVSEKGGMSLDDCVEEQGVGNECGDGSVESVDAPVLQKRIRKPPSYLEDFIR